MQILTDESCNWQVYEKLGCQRIYEAVVENNEYGKLGSILTEKGIYLRKKVMERWIIYLGVEKYMNDVIVKEREVEKVENLIYEVRGVQVIPDYEISVTKYHSNYYTSMITHYDIGKFNINVLWFNKGRRSFLMVEEMSKEEIITTINNIKQGCFKY